MVALAAATIVPASKCFVPLQGTALNLRYQPPASRLNIFRSPLRTWKRRALPHRNVVTTSSSSHQNVSTTNLSEERDAEDAGNYKILFGKKIKII